MSDPTVDADAFNAFEASGWDAQSAGYDEFFPAITNRLIEPLLDAAGVGPGVRVLDVATGPGYAASAATDRGASAVGVDVSGEMLALARRRDPRLDLRAGDAEALPFADASFDAAVANFLILHVGRPEQVAAELARVVAPGGRVALTVWDAPDRARILGIAVDAMAAGGAVAPDDVPAGPPFFRFSDDGQFAALLAGAGLVEPDVRTIAFTQTLSSAELLWRGLVDGTVRTGALIRGQAPAVQAAVRARFDELAERHRVAGALQIPVSVKLASARKPG
jgi:SAM-dependent methyltransferase